MSTSFKKVQADYLGLSGEVVGIDTSDDFALVLPCPAAVQAQFTVPGKKLYLPPMNESNSLRLGESIEITNIGYIPFSIYDNDLASIYDDVPPLATVKLTLETASTAGTWVQPLMLNGERIISVEVAAPHEISPDSDCGKTFYFTAGTQLTLLARTAYPIGFYFNAVTTGGTIGQVIPNAGDLINGETQVSLNNYAACTVINVGDDWFLISFINGGFSPSTGLLSPEFGGTGVDNDANTLTVTAASHINQDVRTTGSPTFTNVDLTTGGALRTGTSNTNTVLFQAYDVNNTLYRTFGTLTAGNTPSLVLAGVSGGTFNITDADLISAIGIINSDTWVQSDVMRQAGTNSTFSLNNTGTSTSAASIAITSTSGGITLTPASGKEVTVTNLTARITTTDVTGTSQQMAINNAYVSNNGSLVTLTLPVTASVGDMVSVSGFGIGGWRIAQNASQLIRFGSSTTTTGTGGRLDSGNQCDSITLRCLVANTTWGVTSAIGNITVT